jgi:hypothetical protein
VKTSKPFAILLTEATETTKRRSSGYHKKYSYVPKPYLTLNNLPVLNYLDAILFHQNK